MPRENKNIMQISIDIRGHTTDTIYGNFIFQTLLSVIKNHTKYSYRIYTHKNEFQETGENTTIISTPFQKNSIFGQRAFGKILKKDTSHLYIFFDEYVPFGYKKNYIVIIPTLQEVFFPSLNSLQKYIHQWYMQSSTNRAQKVLCFDQNTACELNEKINVKESAIAILPGFFPVTEETIDISDIKLDIKAKHNIPGEYLIYDSGNSEHHNFERILKIFERLSKQGDSLSLIIISDEATKDVELRQQVLERSIEKRILFLGNVEKNEEKYYYSQSVGVIFPGFYNSFPFHFWKAIRYDITVIASNLQSTKEIMGEEVYYFNSGSTSEAADTIKEAIKPKKKGKNYIEIEKKLHAQNTATTLIDIVSLWESKSGI